MELVLEKLLSEGEESNEAEARPKFRLVVPNSSCGGIIGKGGATIKPFIEDSHAGIKISPQDNNFVGLHDRLVTIIGPLNSQMRAIHLILSKLSEDVHYPPNLSSPFPYAGLGFPSYPAAVPVGYMIPQVPYNNAVNYEPNGYAAGGGGGRYQNNKPGTPVRSPANNDAQESHTIGFADEHIGAVVGHAGRNITEIIQDERISDLPDHVFHHLLSFLPARAAVQTCVLAKRWRYLWRSTTGLRLGDVDGEEPFCVCDQHEFVDHLLTLLVRTDLHTVEMEFDFLDKEHDQPYVNRWIRFAMMSKVHALKVDIFDGGVLYLDEMTLVSRHLKKLVLANVDLPKTSLDVASCPALEYLNMQFCRIRACRISSCSMKHLTIKECITGDRDCRLCISTPGLVSLKLDGFACLTPLLGDMPLLETAYVSLGWDDYDACLSYHSGVFCGANNSACKNCASVRNSVLLGGISSAKHLVLVSSFRKFIFSRDLKHCPTFTKLKTLLLNEYWCEAPDLDPLACILKNSPVLEKLTLQLFRWGSHEVEMKGRYSSVKRSAAISEHLKVVEIRCNKLDDRILKVLVFLSAFNIPKLTHDPLHALCKNSVSIPRRARRSGLTVDRLRHCCHHSSHRFCYR